MEGGVRLLEVMVLRPRADLQGHPTVVVCGGWGWRGEYGYLKSWCSDFVQTYRVIRQLWCVGDGVGGGVCVFGGIYSFQEDARERENLRLTIPPASIALKYSIIIIYLFNIVTCGNIGVGNTIVLEGNC